MHNIVAGAIAVTDEPELKTHLAKVVIRGLKDTPRDEASAIVFNVLSAKAGSSYCKQVIEYTLEKKSEASFQNLTHIKHMICTLLTTNKITVDGADLVHLVDHFVINAYVIKAEDVMHLGFLEDEDYSKFVDLVILKIFEKHERQPKKDSSQRMLCTSVFLEVRTSLNFQI